MKIETKYHGNVEINENEIITFEKGLPGFLDEKKFAILPLTDEGMLLTLQSLTSDQLAFVITNPFQFFKTYEFDLDDKIIEELEVASEQDVRILTILTVQDPFEKTTANLVAPIVINVKNNKAKQIILNDVNYQTKHPIFHVKTPVHTKG